jgi:hypothetical protein
MKLFSSVDTFPQYNLFLKQLWKWTVYLGQGQDGNPQATIHFTMGLFKVSGKTLSEGKEVVIRDCPEFIKKDCPVVLAVCEELLQFVSLSVHD